MAHLRTTQIEYIRSAIRYIATVPTKAAMSDTNVAWDVTIEYTNWRGERSTRRVRPTGEMIFKSTQWHLEPQWLIRAIDLDKREERLFAIADIHSWKKE